LEETGAFNNSDLQGLYETLVGDGKASLVDALLVGATIEDLDIFDLKTQLEVVDNADIQAVFQNLMAGSENHMRAFVRRLFNQDAVYEAQYISPEELETILAAQGRGFGGRGQGRNGVRDGSCDGTGTGGGNVGGRGQGRNGVRDGSCDGTGTGGGNGRGPGRGNGGGNGSGDGTCPYGN